MQENGGEWRRMEGNGAYEGGERSIEKNGENGRENRERGREEKKGEAGRKRKKGERLHAARRWQPWVERLGCCLDSGVLCMHCERAARRGRPKAW